MIIADLYALSSRVGTEKCEISFARQHRLTLNTLAQGAWALLLKALQWGRRRAVRRDGIRPAGDVARCRIDGRLVHQHSAAAGPPPANLHRPPMAERSAGAADHDAAVRIQLARDIQGWSEVPRGVPLFESIFVFENLPAGDGYESENR